MTPSKHLVGGTGAHKYLAESCTSPLSARRILKSEGYCYTIIPWLVATPFLLMFVAPFVLYGGELDFRTSDGVYHITVPHLYYSLFVCASWLALVVACAYLFSRWRSKKSAMRYWERSELLRFFILLCTTGLPVFVLHQLVKFPAAFENIVHIIGVAAYLAFGLGIGLIFDRRWDKQDGIPSFEIILTCSLFAVLALLPILLGKAVEAACTSAVLIAALSVIRVRRASRYAAILLAGSLVTAAMVVKTPIRQLLYDGSVYARIEISDRCFPRLLDCLHEKMERPSIEAFSFWFDDDIVSFSSFDPNFNKIIFSETVLGRKPHYILARILHRLNHLGVLAHAISLTPDALPFWGWRTYIIIPYTMVPRAIWPGKPQAGVANLFGRQYKILDQDDMQTTANIDPVTEAWIDGGWLAILLSSVVTGVLLGGLLRWLRSGGDQEIRFLAAIIVAANLVYFESEAALILGNLLQQLVFLGGMLVVFRLLTKWPLLTKWHRLFRNPAGVAIPSRG
jgi:hypothetical protein